MTASVVAPARPASVTDLRARLSIAIDPAQIRSAAQSAVELGDMLANEPEEPSHGLCRDSYGFMLLDMTEDLALELLRQNPSNRSRGVTTVMRYCEDMLRGVFLEQTGETVKVSRSGKLLDGQHRLLAFLAVSMLRPGFKQQVSISVGLAENVQGYIDRGRVRSFRDDARMAGVRNSNEYAAAARQIYLLANRRADGYSARCGDAVIKQWLDQEGIAEELAAFIDEKMPLCRQVSNLARSVFLASAWMIHQVDAADAEEFLRSFASGANLPVGSPILALRNRLARIKSQRERTTTTALAAYVCYAWNLWRLGRTVAVLKPTGLTMGTFPWPR